MSILVQNTGRYWDMETNWSGLDLKALKTIYEEKVQALHAALLNGGEWETLRDQRHEVTQLSILMSKRRLSHPAAVNRRPEK